MAIHSTRLEVLKIALARFTLISVPKLRELITWAMSGLSGCKRNKIKIYSVSSEVRVRERERHV